VFSPKHPKHPHPVPEAVQEPGLLTVGMNAAGQFLSGSFPTVTACDV
jgi:hypothetical protein